MNELARQAAAKVLQKEPELQELFEQFETDQEELDRLLDLMGAREVMVEIPPAGNANATLHANVSGTHR